MVEGVQVDTDEMDAFARANNVRTLPYVLLFRRGQGKLLGMELSPYKCVSLALPGISWHFLALSGSPARIQMCL